MPLFFYWAFVVFTFVALYVSPAKYVEINMLSLTLYVLAVTAVFSVGYFFGSSGGICLPEQCANNFSLLIRQKKTQYIINYLLFLGVCGIFYDATTFFRAGGIISFSGLGDSYKELYSSYVRGEGKINLSYLTNIFFDTVSGLCLFFGSFYFSRLTGIQKFVFLFVIGVFLIISVLGSGKQKYLGDVVVATFVFFIFLKSRSRSKIGITKLFFFSVLAIGILFIFLEILKQRYATAGISVENINEVIHPLMYWELESRFFEIFGKEYGFILGIFLGYFTNGLYGLSLCLRLPFEWTYFVGNSYSLTRIIEIILGESGGIYNLTYSVRAAEVYGWDASKWHSLYAWMASDFTFYGVVVIAGIFGFFYGKLWVMSINASRLASGPLFAMLTLGLVFSLANNQLMHSLSSILGLLFLFFLMLVTKPVNKKY